ncbi:MAG: hypothetical protein LC792_17710 [Actinobacteria bacterium]|nr:hypothetical protein [Actinomycetota bacterium]
MTPLGTPTVAYVIEVAAGAFGLDPTEITGPGRSLSLARARLVTMAVARALCGASYPELARAFGGRDHATVVAACRRVGADPVLAAAAGRLAAMMAEVVIQ